MQKHCATAQNHCGHRPTSRQLRGNLSRPRSFRRLDLGTLSKIETQDLDASDLATEAVCICT